MALTLLAANNAQTVLAAGISSSATSLTVNTGTGSLFPSPSAGVSYFKMTMIDAATGQLTEIVHVTARSGDTMTIARGQEGTTARAWSANDIVANMLTAGTISLLAPLDSPALSGTPTAPTPAGADNTTKVATTAFVQSSISPLATIASPTFTGTPAAPTAAVGTNTTQLATTAFVANSISANTGRLINIQVFTSSGTYTPTSGTKKIRVRLVGGGAGGGGAAANTTSGTFSFGNGGTSGCYGETGLIDASAITTVAVTVGSAGTGGVGSGNGTVGGPSSFGSYITAPGGIAGTGGLSTTAGTAVTIAGISSSSSCTGSSVMLNIPGGNSGSLVSLGNVTYTQILGGSGGSSVLGFGGAGGNAGVAAKAGTGYGAGGAGGSALYVQSTAANNGANGSAGIVIVEEYA